MSDEILEVNKVYVYSVEVECPHCGAITDIYGPVAGEIFECSQCDDQFEVAHKPRVIFK